MLIFQRSDDNLMRVLVIGSCGKRKRFSIQDAPKCDVLTDRYQLDVWVQKHPDSTCQARDMYTGNQSRELVRAVDLLRKIEGVEVKFYIISAGFGLLAEEEIIPPYECSFNGMKRNEIRQRSSELIIRESFDEISRQKYDLSYIAAGKNFVQGGFYAEGLRSISALKKDIPAPKTEDMVEIEGVRYRIQSLYDNPNGVYGFNLTRIENA